MLRVGLALVLLMGLGVQPCMAERMVGSAGFSLAQEIEAASQQRALHPGGQPRCRGRTASAQRRGGKKASERRGQRRPRRRHGLRQVLRCLKPVLKQVLAEVAPSDAVPAVEDPAASGAEGMDQTATVSCGPTTPASPLNQFEQRIELVVVKPDYTNSRCPKCGGATEWVKSYHSHPWDAHLDHATVLDVYREIRRCKTCRKRFAPELDFVDLNGRYTHRVKRMAVAAVVEDGMPIERVPARMKRDFHLPELSGPTVHAWVQAAAGTVPPEGEYTRWVVERFSGVVGLDEVVMRDAHGKKQYLTVAVDALNQRTIVFDLLANRDHDAMVKFLQKLKDMGIRPEVVITDMWKSYAGALAEVFPAARQQLCVFHVVQDVMKHVNKAFLTYRRSLPKETAADKALRQELLDFRYTLLTSAPKLSAAQQERVDEILRQHAGTLLAEAYYCKEAVLTLFRVSRTPAAARQRRDQLVQRFGRIPELKPVITLLSGKPFEDMIVYLDYENLDKTNNDIERTNRTYQHGEDQRYRARTDRTRLNYVKLQARQRNRRNAERNERLKRKPPPAHSFRVDDVAQTIAQSWVA